MISLRVSRRLIIAVIAYRPNAENTKAALRDLTEQTLAEFDLTGVID